VLGLVVAVAAGLGIGFARGGRIGNLSSTKLRGIPIVFAGVVLQLASTFAERADVRGLPLALVLASFACVFGFAALNWRLPGMTLIALGALMNFTVISANAGMPVSLHALDVAGLGDVFSNGHVLLKGAHHALTPASRLRFLADVIPVKLSSNVISAGDIVIWAGLLVLVQQLMVGRPGRRRAGRRADEEERELSARRARG